MKRRFSLFTYPMMDMKAAEVELNRRAAAGCRPTVCYCIDWVPGGDNCQRGLLGNRPSDRQRAGVPAVQDKALMGVGGLLHIRAWDSGGGGGRTAPGRVERLGGGGVCGLVSGWFWGRPV